MSEPTLEELRLLRREAWNQVQAAWQALHSGYVAHIELEGTFQLALGHYRSNEAELILRLAREHHDPP